MIGKGHSLEPAAGVPSQRHIYLGHGRHANGRPDPSHHRLVPYSHRQDIESAEVNVLAPVERSLPIHKPPVREGDPHGEHVAQITVGNQVAEGVVNGERMGRRHDLRDQVRVLTGRVQHHVSLVGVHRHARFAEHVLVALQRVQRGRAMQVRPRPDTDGIGVIGLDQLQPVVVDLGDAELTRHAFPGLAGAIGDADDLHVLDRPKARDVFCARVRARADDAETNPISCVLHASLPNAHHREWRRRISRRIIQTGARARAGPAIRRSPS